MELLEEITSFADNELKDPVVIGRLKKLIGEDEAVRAEYLIQSRTKNLLSKRFANQTAPDYLKYRITENLRKNIPEEAVLFLPQKKSTLKKFFVAKYIFVTAAILLFILLVSMPFSSENTSEILALQQKGKSNLLVQAQNNFYNIIRGKLSLHFNSSDPKDVIKYFSNKGVTYKTVVPKCPSWKVEGAVISEIDGVKLAHSVYKNSKGEILYLYQVDEKMLNNNSKLCLSGDLCKYLNNGGALKIKENDYSIIMLKQSRNIVAVASNSNLENVETSFLTYLK